ncbi:MAG: SGNH/GDSL hydrolase family protein [Candidatus Omnitrophica bacterium]|nr:SGNH/GDSL hydrolase family protein [Candidatus Omnitrophota bacterium]
MTAKNRIYAFFIALALLFWNPVSFYALYASTPAFASATLHFFYWAVCIAGALSIVLVMKNKTSERVNNILLACAYAGIFFAVLVVIDRVVPVPRAGEGLIFQPQTRVRYHTTEFDFTAEINSLGFRDRAVAVDKGGKFRVVCVGDSFTFGWGVSVENSWPKKLETYLAGRGYKNIEVLNLGQPGQCTATYKKIIAKAVPLLKPDLVLVGVLEGDDLVQLYEDNYRARHPNPNGSFWNTLSGKAHAAARLYLAASFKNVMSRLKQNMSRPVEVQLIWKRQATARINAFNDLQRINFSTWDSSVQELFRGGNLNPALLSYYMDFPLHEMIFNDLRHPATQWAARTMDQDFQEMKKMCDTHGARLVFVNIPDNFFIGHLVMRNPSDSVLAEYLEKNNRIGEIYRSIAAAHALVYIELIEHFRRLPDKTAYFFRYDGHPNETGYQEIADYIGARLLEKNIIPKE